MYKRQALTDIDLHIKSGETIGIIGGTGSSKSSLIQLVSRLYDATEGCVKVGGRDVRDYDLEALRNQVAVVLQKNVLFSGTIKMCIRDRKAVDQGHLRAMHNLAWCYRMGQPGADGPDRKEKAVELFRRAASQGYMSSVCDLSLIHI